MEITIQTQRDQEATVTVTRKIPPSYVGPASYDDSAEEAQHKKDQTRVPGANATSPDFVHTSAHVYYTSYRSHINRLPVELIVLIFSLLTASTGSPIDSYRRIVRPHTQMGWARFMLVCQRWRKIGLATPHLWRRISVTPSRLESLEYRLSRSLGCTVDIWFSSSSAAAIPLLVRHAPRIRSISITNSFAFSELPSIRPLLNVLLPALQHIDIRPCRRFGHNLISASNESIAEEYFDLGLHEHPQLQLRTVAAEGLIFPRSPRLWEKLTFLRLTFQFHKEKAWCADDVLDILEMTPFLRHLQVKADGIESSLRAPPGHINERTCIKLSSLRHIQLDGSFLLISRVLQCVLAPALYEFRVRTEIPAGFDVVHSTTLLFPPALRHVLRDHTELYFNSRIFGGPDGLHIGDSEYGGPGLDDLEVWLYGVHGRLSLEVGLREGKYSSDALNAFCHVFSAAPLRTLKMEDIGGAPSADAWKNVLKTFTTLRTLELSDHYPRRPDTIYFALDAIATLPEHEECAELTTLYMECCYLKRTLESHDWAARALDAAIAQMTRGKQFEVISFTVDKYCCTRRHPADHCMVPHWAILASICRRCSKGMCLDGKMYQPIEGASEGRETGGKPGDD